MLYKSLILGVLFSIGVFAGKSGIGLAYLLERQALPEEARELASKIHQSGRSLLGILNDILDLSKIESNRIEIEHAAFRLDAVLGNLATIMTATAADKSLELVIRPPDCLDCTLLGDSLRLGQILINLTGNAIKFTASGVVEVGIDILQRTESRLGLRFAVRDTGIGIDTDTHARLFQPFAQADASTTRRFGGSGLGLAISRRLVELMGGCLTLDSTPGVGSCDQRCCSASSGATACISGPSMWPASNAASSRTTASASVFDSGRRAPFQRGSAALPAGARRT